jgi:Domain of unknown function (DUF4159)
MGSASRARRVAVVAVLLIVCTVAVAAQFRRGDRFRSIRPPTADTFQGGFNFCRIRFSGSRGGDGGSWSVDYPRADVNLSIRAAELTKLRITTQPSGEPEHVVISLTDDELFQCPFVMMTEVGSAYIGPDEAARLREYLQKGGFLWADDFWGSYAWEHWVHEITKVLPPPAYQIGDLPRDHPLFRAQFEIKQVPQIPSINFWMGSGGGTSERYGDSEEPHALGISDSRGRLLVLMTHNTDLGDSWEREADDPSYFYSFSVDGYAFGLNVLLYALTH